MQARDLPGHGTSDVASGCGSKNDNDSCMVAVHTTVATMMDVVVPLVARKVVLVAIAKDVVLTAAVVLMVLLLPTSCGNRW